MTEEQKIEFDKWNEFITSNIRGVKTQKALKMYVQKLLLNNTVIILDFNHLSQLLGIHTGTLTNIVIKSKSFYYDFEIPKRTGGSRLISAPYPVLLNAQKWIYENLLIKQPLHKNAKGFIKRTSIVDNAKEHLNQKFLLKMDIKDFFPSVKINRIISIFRNLGYTKKISYYLASICCLDGVLPQGAPTSPVLSNIIAKRLDYRLTGLANKFELNYTRYADDFTFSGKKLPVRLIEYIEKIINEEGFKINKEKTKLLNEKKQKIVTGISISSGRMTIPKKTKREVRKNIHYVLTNGLFEHQRKIHSFDPIYLERLLGYLYFWISIEPDCVFVRSSIEKLKNYSIKLNE
jgi:RNA-directed DNA polymerase